MVKQTKLKITQSIVYTLGILVLLYAIHTLFSFQAMQRLLTLTRSIYDHPLVVSNASRQANLEILKMHRDMKDVVLFGDPGILESAIKEIDQLEIDVFRQLQTIQTTILGDQGEKIAAETLRLFKAWKPIRDRVIGLARRGERGRAATITKTEGAAQVIRLERQMVHLAEYAGNKARGFIQETEAIYSGESWWSLIFLGAWVILSCLTALLTIRRTRLMESALTRDQTEEREYQNRIRENEKKFRLLSDNTLDVIWTMNLDLEFTYANPAILTLMGYEPEEWIGSRLSEHCDQAHLDQIYRIIGDEIAKGPESNGIIFETVMLKKNRDPLPVEIHGRVVYDQNQQPAHIQGAARDISERKRAEATRRYHDRLLRDVGKIAKIGGWEFDPATGKGTWTEEVARIHDLDPAGEPCGGLGLNFFQGKARTMVEKAVKEAVEQGKPYDLELEAVSAKGVHKWVRTMGRPTIEKGRVVQVRGALQDITERKIAEQRIAHLNQVLRAIRDVNQLIVREKDPDVLIQQGCRLLADNRGYASALIIRVDKNGKPFSWARAGIAAACEALVRFLENGELPPCCDKATPEMAVVLTEKRKDACATCPIIDESAETHTLSVPLVQDGITLGFLVVSLDHDLSVDDEERSLFAEISGDIAYALKVLQLGQSHQESERKRASLEGQLFQAQKMESVGRLAGGVAHDYNNMLSVIIGYTELAMDKVGPDEPLHNDLKEILSAAHRSSEITRQLLAFARKQTIAPKVLDLNDMVESMLKMLRRLIGEDIVLAWRPRAELWPIKIDPAQIDQILANLCVNARDAIVGVGNITIETGNTNLDEIYCAEYRETVPGDYVFLAVSDDGHGMDQETMKKVFDPFFTTKALGKGTGLGLSTVYGIAKQNHGFVNIYSEPQRGTTVKIFLPRHRGQLADAHDDHPLEIPLSRGETVLIVEDDASILKLGTKMLKVLGYSVLGASTPGKALDVAVSYAEEIQLLITDVIMPEMNGRELAERLQAHYPGLKILFMSGYTANIIAHQGVLDEGLWFIQKPFSRRDLAHRVREVLDRPSCEQAG
jgi:PAS domain S-box-containing protein